MELLIENIKWIISTAITLAKSGLGFSKNNKNERIEVVQAKVDTSVSDWYQDQEVEQAFFIKEDAQKLSPVLDFSFFNHFTKPLVLKTIEVNVREFSMGLSGIDEEPVIKVEPSTYYSFKLNKNQDLHVFPLSEPLEIDKQRAFRLQLELLLPDNKPLIERYGLWFTFEFNNKISIKPEPILLNSNREDGKISIQMLQ